MGIAKWLPTVSSAAVVSSIALPMLAGSVGTAFAAAAGPAHPGGTWGKAILIPGLAALDTGGDATVSAVSCASPGNCAAVGSYEDSRANFQPFVVNEVGGVWGGAREVPGIAVVGTARNPESGAQIQSVSCHSPGYCEAGGSYLDNDNMTHAFVVSEAGGTWGKARALHGAVVGSQVVGAVVASVSCGAAGFCSAIGNYTAGPNSSSDIEYPFVAIEVHGIWGNAETVTGLGSLTAGGGAVLDSLSCASAGNCGASGYRFNILNDYSAFVVSESSGTWGGAEDVQGLSNTEGEGTLAIACATAGNCSAAGFDNGGPDSHTFTVDETDGTWGTAQPIPAVPANTGMLPTAVSCASPGNCTIYGPFARGDGSYSTFVADEVSGTVGAATEIPGLSSLNAGLVSPSLSAAPVSCAPTGYCAAGGQFAGTGPAGLQAFVAGKVNGTWRTAHEVAGLPTLKNSDSDAAVTSISCGATGYCSAGGSYMDASFHMRAFVIDEATASATTMTASATTVPYGDERAVRLSVAVTSPAGGTPAGTVAVSAGPVVVCTVTLRTGTGGCTLPATRLPAGIHRLTAAYGGNASYLPSASGQRTLTVVKAVTRASLVLSRAVITYGQETAEHLTVTVTARFAGTPAGKVTVKAGSSTVCVITLGKAGKGACTLTARQLRAGTYTLIASYAGSANDKPSTSARKTLKIAR
jgi:hypothetical protein